MQPLRPLDESDRPALRRFWKEHWGDDFMVVRGQVYSVEELEGFVTTEDGAWTGLATFRVDGELCEIMSLDSLREGRGTGTALIRAIEQEARRRSCTRLRLVTTNDNTHALRFYQKRGFRLVALRPNALDEARRLKPSIPATGNAGIPLRDELELELRLVASPC